MFEHPAPLSQKKSPVQTLMIADDSSNYHARLSTNYHALSSTIMHQLSCFLDVFKLDSIVDDSFYLADLQFFRFFLSVFVGFRINNYNNSFRRKYM